MNISNYRDKIELYNFEANDFINHILLKHSSNNIFIFFDPPYYEQGKNLYTNFFKHEDHEILKSNIDKLKEYHWILTYDNQIEISKIYKEYSQHLYSINYSANRTRRESELFIHNDKTKVKSFGKVYLRDF